MDLSIRKLIARSREQQDVAVLNEAFDKLKKGRKAITDQKDPFSSDLFVLCAELALEVRIYVLFELQTLFE